MKKIVSLLLSLMLVIGMMSTALADTVDAGTVQPGAVLTFGVHLTAVSGEAAVIGIETDGAPVEFVDAEGGNVNDTLPPNTDSGLNGNFMVLNMPNATMDKYGNISGNDVMSADLVTGLVGKLTIKVSDDAAPGEYTVSTYVSLGSATVDGKVTFTVEEPVTRVPGDVDEDGDVDLVDVMQVSRYVYVDNTMTINLLNADIDENGEITLVDIMQIARLVYPG